MTDLSPAKLKNALLELQAQHHFSSDLILELEKEILAGKAQELLDFKHTPVDIETFLTDSHFMGGITKDSWPKPIESVIEIVEGGFSEVILTGSTGRSKNTRANWILAYDLYILQTLTNPARYCNLLEGSNILMMMMNRSMKTAERGTFKDFFDLIARIPFFNDLNHPEFSYNKDFKSRLVFKNNVEVGFTVASPTNDALGRNFVGGILDEMNFMQVVDKSKKSVDGKVYDQAKDTYTTLSERIKNRFLTTKRIPSTLAVVTSRASDADFTAWRLSQLNQQCIRNNEEKVLHSTGYSIGKTFVSDGPKWTFQPAVNKDGSVRYCGDMFHFAISDGKNPSEIIENPKNKNEVKGREVIEIPVEYKDEFIKNPEQALANTAGMVSKATGRYFASYMKHVYKATEDYTNKKFEPIFAEYDEAIDTWDLDHGFPPINRKYMVLNQHIPRFCHIDLALTGDNAGISIGYSPHDIPLGSYDNTYNVERKPKIIYEACLAITPPREGRINFEMIRSILYYLKEKIGVNLRYISLDGFNSADMMQILEANLFEVKYISVSGKNSLGAYEALRTAFGEGTISIPPNKLMLKEFRELVYNGKVVDHPLVSEDGNEGSNDVVDAVTGVHKNMMEYYHQGTLYDFDNYEVLSLYG